MQKETWHPREVKKAVAEEEKPPQLLGAKLLPPLQQRHHQRHHHSTLSTTPMGDIRISCTPLVCGCGTRKTTMRPSPLPKLF